MSADIEEGHNYASSGHELNGMRSDIYDIKRDLRDIEKAHIEYVHSHETKLQELAFKDVLMDRKQDAILSKLDSTEKSQKEMWGSIGELKDLVSTQVAASIKAQGEFTKTLTKLIMTTLGYGIVGAGLLVFSVWSFQEWNQKIDLSNSKALEQYESGATSVRTLETKLYEIDHHIEDLHPKK